MPSRNTEKTKDSLKELGRTISPVLVVNNSALKPYVELFEYSPENIYQQPLGSLVGFFEIKEYSENSAYVVNFLNSVLKKEYYVNPKRPVTESLDAALYKVNLALSELAKHGNVEWLGKLNAAICVIEKNSAHFSIAGESSIFLYRNKGMTDISEGLASDMLEPHPLKTFVNVSSGRLEKNDRLLITTRDIFHILSENDLRKNFERLKDEKFVQYLKTALSNQLEMIASIVVEMKQPMTEAAAKKIQLKKKETQIINAFSEKAFEQPLPEAAPEEDMITEIDEQLEYTDKKTGHIYIQGEANSSIEATSTQIYLELAKDKVAEGWFQAKNTAKKKIHLYRIQLEKKLKQQYAERQARREKIAEEKRQAEIIAEMEREEQAKIQLEMEKQSLAQQEATKKQAEQDLLEQKLAQEEISADKAAKNEQDLLDEEIRVAQERILSRARTQVIDLKKQKNKEIQSVEEIIEIPEAEETFEEAYKYAEIPEQKIEEKESLLSKIKVLMQDGSVTLIKLLKIALEKIISIFGSIKKKESESAIIPHLSKITRLFSRFTFKQKAFAAAALLAVFIVPIFIAKFLDRPAKPTISSITAVAPSLSDTLAMDKNINLNSETKAVLSKPDAVGVIISNAGPVLVTKSSLIPLANGAQKEYTISPDAGAITKATFMNDLSLILVLTDKNKVISFSPTSLKFSDNAINLDGISPSSFIGTYLTYLYVLDTKSNQIYRYPRATGGFGDRTDWYKDTVSLASASDLTIDDNIYVISENKVLKFFKGKQASLTLENSNTPVNFSKLFTTVDSTSLYALDVKNERLIKYAKDSGQITAQYHSDALLGGISLSVDEQNKLAYITTVSGLISVSLQ